MLSGFIKRVLLLAVGILLPAGIYTFFWSEYVLPVSVVFTSDGHGHILPSRAYWKDGSPRMGGFGALAGFLSGLREPYLLTDSGDFFQGTPEAVLTQGRAVIDLMNHLGYTAAAAGNHDFDLGQDVLAGLAGRARFPILASNISIAETGEAPGYLKPYTLVEVNGLNIGVTGAITAEMDRLALPENIEGLEFTDPVKAVNLTAAAMRDEGARIIIMLSHLGLGHDLKAAAELKGAADIIIGGHSHSLTKKPHLVGRTLVSHPGQNFLYAGFIRLYYSLRDNRILAYSHRNVPLYVEKYPAGEEITGIIETAVDEITLSLDEVIGESAADLPRNLSGDGRFHRELALGNLQADIMREALGTDFAFQNTGGIRAGIHRGPVYLRDIWTLLPFGNHLVEMSLTGDQIRDLLEESVSQGYSSLQVSGLRVLYNSSLPPGRRLLNVIVSGEDGRDYELDDGKVYTVTTNSFLAAGGDGYTIFAEAGEVSETTILLRDLMIEYIRTNSPIYAETEGRLINVSIE